MDFNGYLQWNLTEYGFLWLIAIIITWIVGFLFWRLSRKEGILDVTKKIYLGYAIYAFLFGICKLFFTFSNYDYNPNSSTQSFEYEVFYAIGMIIQIFALAILIYDVSRYLLNTKGYITLIPIANLAIMPFFFNYWEVYCLISQILAPVYAIIIMIAYLIIARSAPGEICHRAIMTIFSFVLFVVAMLIDARFIKDVVPFWLGYIVPPIIFIIGLTLFFYYTRIKV